MQACHEITGSFDRQVKHADWCISHLFATAGEEGRSSRLVAIIEGMDGAFDDQGRSHHILPLASPRGPNRMYAPRDRVNGFRTTQMGRRPVPSGVIGRLPPASEYRAEPKLGGEPATPMPHSLSPPRTLPNRYSPWLMMSHNSKTFACATGLQALCISRACVS